MGKMKVYELAKELNVQSKDIVNYLQEKGIEGKVAQSSLEDDAVAIIKKKFDSKAAVAAEQPKEDVDASKDSAEAPKKKKRIVIVGNPQNSKNGMNTQPKQQKPQAKPQERHQEKPQPKQETKSDISADQVAAKFKAILGEGKSNKPQTNTEASANTEAAATVNTAANKTTTNTVGSVASIAANAPTLNIVSRGNVIPKNAPNGERKENHGENRDNRENRGEGRQGGYNNDRRNDRRNDNRDNRENHCAPFLQNSLTDADFRG
jgi:translation initiation factor IF-2